MSLSFARSQSKKEEAHSQATEGDPLLPPRNNQNANNNNNTTDNNNSGLRSRRTSSKSPPVLNDFGATREKGGVPMRRPDGEGNGEEHHHDDADSSFQGFVAIHDEDGSMPRSIRQQGSLPSITDDETSGPYSVASQKDADLIGIGQTSQYQRTRSPDDSRSLDSNSQPPLLEIPEEIYAVRKAALKVMKPLTKTWVRVFFLLKIPC